MEKGLIIGFVILAAAAVIVGLFTGGFGLFSIATDTTHHVTAFGQNFTLTAGPNFGTSGYCESYRFQNAYYCSYTTVTDTSNGSINIQTTLPAAQGGDHSASMSVTLDSIDLRAYAKVVIHRGVSINIPSGWDPSSSDNLMGLTDTGRGNNPASHIGALSKAYGDVIITNDGAAITVQAAEGRLVLAEPSTPLYFTNSLGIANHWGGGGGTMSYQITGVELTPFPVNAPQTDTSVTTNTTTTTDGGGSNPPPATTPGFLQRIWAWILNLFTYS